MAAFEKVVIVGVGLLGGSIGLALRQRGLARQVVGFGRNQQNLDKAVTRGAIDSYESELVNACQGANLCVICTPVQDIATRVVECSPHLASDGLITDVGSTKQNICESLAKAGIENFCGSHPLAGSDRSGVEHADEKLFEDRLTVVTPLQTNAMLLRRTLEFWESIGCKTQAMSPQEHDWALAQTSHLPHIVAAALAAGTPASLLPLAATGWRDTTRIAGGSPSLWRQIIEENRPAILEAIKQYNASLKPWVDALENQDFDQVESLLTAGKEKRDNLGS